MLGRKQLAQVKSKYNGLITVYSVFGSPRMEVGTLLQSGGIISKIWQTAFKAKNIKLSLSPTILVLGLGAGTILDTIYQQYPQAIVYGVEIDPQVIAIGQKYFKLSQHVAKHNLQIINDDAISFVNKIKSKPQFDLIIVDVYQGKAMIKSMWQQPFLITLKKLLKPKGAIIFNHLFWGKYKNCAKNFIKICEPTFSQVTLSRTLANLLIFVKK